MHNHSILWATKQLNRRRCFTDRSCSCRAQKWMQMKLFNVSAECFESDCVFSTYLGVTVSKMGGEFNSLRIFKAILIGWKWHWWGWHHEACRHIRHSQKYFTYNLTAWNIIKRLPYCTLNDFKLILGPVHPTIRRVWADPCLQLIVQILFKCTVSIQSFNCSLLNRTVPDLEWWISSHVRLPPTEILQPFSAHIPSSFSPVFVYSVTKHNPSQDSHFTALVLLDYTVKKNV